MIAQPDEQFGQLIQGRKWLVAPGSPGRDLFPQFVQAAAADFEGMNKKPVSYACLTTVALPIQYRGEEGFLGRLSSFDGFF